MSACWTACCTPGAYVFFGCSCWRAGPLYIGRMRGGLRTHRAPSLTIRAIVTASSLCPLLHHWSTRFDSQARCHVCGTCSWGAAAVRDLPSSRARLCRFTSAPERGTRPHGRPRLSDFRSQAPSRQRRLFVKPWWPTSCRGRTVPRWRFSTSWCRRHKRQQGRDHGRSG